jgi:hypothetical protein
MPVKHSPIVLTAIYLATIWVIAVLPLVSVLLEYGEDCAGTSLGWFIATLYGSFFIYPMMIGGMAMAAVLLPTASAVSLIRARKAEAAFIAFYAVTTLIIAVLEFRSPTALFQIPPEGITSNQPFWNGLVNACSGNHIPFSEYQAQFHTLNASRHSYTGWFYYPGFIAQTLMQNLLFIVLVAFILYPKSEILKRAPLVPGAIFFVLGYAILLGSVWCLFRLSYRLDMMHLFNVNNPFVGDYAIICLYVVAIEVFIVYFQLDLEKLAKSISIVSQVIVLAGGAALFHWELFDQFFGTHATVNNVLTLCLLFIFLSTLTGALVLRFREIEN